MYGPYQQGFIQPSFVPVVQPVALVQPVYEPVYQQPFIQQPFIQQPFYQQPMLNPNHPIRSGIELGIEQALINDIGGGFGPRYNNYGGQSFGGPGFGGPGFYGPGYGW